MKLTCVAGKDSGARSTGARGESTAITGAAQSGSAPPTSRRSFAAARKRTRPKRSGWQNRFKHWKRRFGGLEADGRGTDYGRSPNGSSLSLKRCPSWRLKRSRKISSSRSIRLRRLWRVGRRWLTAGVRRSTRLMSGLSAKRCGGKRCKPSSRQMTRPTHRPN